MVPKNPGVDLPCPILQKRKEQEAAIKMQSAYRRRLAMKQVQEMREAQAKELKELEDKNNVRQEGSSIVLCH